MLFNNTPLLVLIALLTTAAVAAPAPGYKRPQPPQRKVHQSHRAPPPYPVPKTHPEYTPSPPRNEPSHNEPEGSFPSINFDPDLLDLDILNIGKEKRSTENGEHRGRSGSRSKSRDGAPQGLLSI